MDSLRDGQNVPTVLQSLGCMAQYSISTFESHEKVITNYIVEEIFQKNDVFGLKALVRSFLPNKKISLTRPIGFLLEIIQKMLKNCKFCAGSIPCEQDEVFIRLAAAKSVLRLSRKWDLHISPTLFHLTILMSKGVWTGMIIGTFVQTEVLIIITQRTNWEKQVSIAQTRVNKWSGSYYMRFEFILVMLVFQALVECEGEFIDLSGDIGFVVRIVF